VLEMWRARPLPGLLLLGEGHKTTIGTGNETENLQETNGNRQKGQNGKQEIEDRRGGQSSGNESGAG
jgi:hypothetical protein